MTRSWHRGENLDQNSGSTAPDPSEGLRLLRAFMTITNPQTRASVIEFAEWLARQQEQGID